MKDFDGLIEKYQKKRDGFQKRKWNSYRNGFKRLLGFDSGYVSTRKLDFSSAARNQEIINSHLKSNQYKANEIAEFVHYMEIHINRLDNRIGYLTLYVTFISGFIVLNQFIEIINKYATAAALVIAGFGLAEQIISLNKKHTLKELVLMCKFYLKNKI